MKEQLLNYTQEDKNAINDVATLCGVKKEIVSQIFEYFFFSTYLRIMENKDKFNGIRIPFIGTVGVPSDTEQQCFFIKSEDLERSINNIKKDNVNNITKWISENYINNIIKNIETDI